MSMQKTKQTTHETMEHKYGSEAEHKHNKDHQEFREHEKSHGAHLHGGHTAHKGTHHHHHTTHHHHHYYGPVTVVSSSGDED